MTEPNPRIGARAQRDPAAVPLTKPPTIPPGVYWQLGKSEEGHFGVTRVVVLPSGEATRMHKECANMQHASAILLDCSAQAASERMLADSKRSNARRALGEAANEENGIAVSQSAIDKISVELGRSDLHPSTIEELRTQRAGHRAQIEAMKLRAEGHRKAAHEWDLAHGVEMALHLEREAARVPW